ncbi:MAG: phosphatase PAP2 family protein [Oscillospiraceae bacterium]|nr:phosphatase PAP2 family protein [Oscillospiraceae bacterium]
MEILYWLEGIRVPILNEFMLLVTKFGEETLFLVAALTILWCADKRRSYYLLAVGFLGLIGNQFLKLAFRIPRPWVQDPNFTILEQAREAASGYSFPSGHTQTAVGTFGSIAYTTKNKLVRYLCVAVCILVPISRMYIGVHTPLDVTVAAAIAVLLIYCLKPITGAQSGKWMPWILSAMVLCAAAFWAYVEFFPFPADLDAHNYESAVSNAYKFLGAIIGFAIVYMVVEKWLHFEVKAVWWAQILKVAIGFGLVLAVKSGLKAPINALVGAQLGSAVRYFLIVIVAGILWPLSFRFFKRLGNKG